MILFEYFILVIFLIILIIGFNAEFSNKLSEPFDHTKLNKKTKTNCKNNQQLIYPFNPEFYIDYWTWKPYGGKWPNSFPQPNIYPYPYPYPIGYFSDSCVSNLH